jgi:hypothetical protein
MHTTPHHPRHYNYRFLLQAMNGGGTCDNLSINPCLPIITAKTMKWRSVSLIFVVAEKPLAWFSAINTGKEWFSLPHFNNGAYWFNPGALPSAIAQPGKAPIDAVRFYQQFIAGGNWFIQPPEEDQLWEVEMEEADFLQPVRPSTASFQLKVRHFLQLSSHNLSHKTDTQLSLQSSAALQLQAFPASVRRKIMKALRSNFHIETGGIELLHDFYTVYRNRIHGLGSFGLPYFFFEQLFQQYQHGKIQLVIARQGNKPVGSAVLMTFGSYAENPWFASVAEGNKNYVSYLLHFEMMKTAIAEGCTLYSFGYSTRGSSVHKYKQQWGGSDQTIFLSGTMPVVDKLAGKQYLRSLIKRCPLLLSKALDHYIAQRYY